MSESLHHSSKQPTSHTDEFDINKTTYKTGYGAVRKARRFALQGLYEWLLTGRRFEKNGQHDWQDNAPHDIVARTRATNAMHTVHLGYYHDMMRDIPKQIDELEALITPHLDRDIKLLDPIEHVILLIGTYELQNRIDVPYKVVIDEAMKLNTHFGATDAHKLINAVLDKLADELRAIEVKADGNNLNHNNATDKTELTVPVKNKVTDSDNIKAKYQHVQILRRGQSDLEQLKTASQYLIDSSLSAKQAQTGKPRISRKTVKDKTPKQQKKAEAYLAPLAIDTKTIDKSHAHHEKSNKKNNPLNNNILNDEKTCSLQEALTAAGIKNPKDTAKVKDN